MTQQNKWVIIVVQEWLSKIRHVRVGDYSRSKTTPPNTSC